MALKLSDFAGRLLRADDSETLGRPSHVLAAEAIDAGRAEEAKDLIQAAHDESKSLHDLFCDWVWDMLTRMARRCGEQAMFEMLRESQETWMLRRTWKAFRNMSVKRQVDLTAEVMRAHRCGPKQDGEIGIEEDDEKFSIVMDPCGSGGRMRRGDPVDGTPSRLGPPYEFGVTQEAHWWSWGRKDVPYYCLHCAVNEILPIEWGGRPLWVTEFDADAKKPCRWHFYKRPELIPAHYWTRLGKEKPAKFDA
ncbi:MAG: hypothetical protein HOK61_01115 [Alphaproteobacteria bacterium]|nr:hypothetical protein [Alphaproteobacteria bacterium]